MIVTSRLRLREWGPDDLASLAEIFAKPEVWHFPFRRGFSFSRLTLEAHAQTIHDTRRRQARGWSLWAAEDREIHQLIGYIGLLAETETFLIRRRQEQDHVHGVLLSIYLLERAEWETTPSWAAEQLAPRAGRA